MMVEWIGIYVSFRYSTSINISTLRRVDLSKPPYVDSYNRIYMTTGIPLTLHNSPLRLHVFQASRTITGNVLTHIDYFNDPVQKQYMLKYFGHINSLGINWKQVA